MLRRLLGVLRPGRDDSELDSPPGEAEATEQASGRSLWDLVPRRTYGGRHAETGGLSRDEQERSLEEIQARAETIEDAERSVRHPPEDP